MIKYIDKYMGLPLSHYASHISLKDYLTHSYISRVPKQAFIPAIHYMLFPDIKYPIKHGCIPLIWLPDLRQSYLPPPGDTLITIIIFRHTHLKAHVTTFILI